MILSSLPKEKSLLLNDQIVPGIVRSVSVSGRMQADRNARLDGGRDFILKGWEPAEISVDVALLGSGELAVEDLLQEFVGLFKKVEGGKAVQYQLSFPQTNCWGIGRCYLTDLSSSQNSKQMYSVGLKFVEFRPEIDKIQKQQAQKKAEGKAAKQPAGPAPPAKPMYGPQQQRQADALVFKYNGYGAR